MWIIAGHLKVDADERDACVAPHHDLVGRARQAPGCLDIAITADPLDPERINNFERWESWDAVEAWRKVAAAPEMGVPIRDGEVMAYEIANERPPSNQMRRWLRTRESRNNRTRGERHDSSLHL